MINTATNAVTGPVNVGNGANGIAVTPDGTKAYVANRLDGTVSVINTATNTVAATINVASLPIGTAVTPDGTKVYVANNGSNNVSVISTASNTVTATVPVGSGPISFREFHRVAAPPPATPSTPRPTPAPSTLILTFISFVGTGIFVTLLRRRGDTAA